MTPELLRAWVVLIVTVGLMVMLTLGVLDALMGGLGDTGTDALVGVLGLLAGGVGAYLKASLTPRKQSRHKRLP